MDDKRKVNIFIFNKFSVYSNQMVPNNWKIRLGYRDQLLQFIGEDENFCEYLVKMNGSKSLDTFGNKGTNQDKNKYKEKKGKNIKNSNEEINIFSTSDFYKTNNLNKENDEFEINNSKKIQNIDSITSNYNNDNNINMNYEINSTPEKKSNTKNLMQINESHKHEEEEDKNHKGIRNSISYNKGFNNAKKFSNISISNISEKEKRSILEHYRNTYSIKKTSNNKLSEVNKKIDDKKFPFFPYVSGQGQSQFQAQAQAQTQSQFNGLNTIRSSINLNSPLNNENNNNNNNRTQSNFMDGISQDEDESISGNKKSMFRSSIYTSLMSNKTNTNFKKTNLFTEKETIDNNPFNKTKLKINKGKSRTIYGPFLNINNQFEEEIEIKNPEIKRSLEDINYYGPYFSHCPICRHKNLDFYQTMEPHQCMKLLNYIKMKRSNIHVK
jgi:hypothetical protein